MGFGWSGFAVALLGALLFAALPVHASPQRTTPSQSKGPPENPSEGLRLRLDTHGLAPAQIDASQRLLDDALARLPPRFMTRVDRAVPVRWSDALPHPSYGRA